jgi:chloramphenicol 3-O phosphotransferase
VNKGRIIILVGGSSAGKTSLGKALQGQFKELHLLMGIDMFWFTLPPKQCDLNTVDPEYFSWDMEKLGDKQMFRIKPGPVLDRLMIGRYYAIAAYLDRGFNIIADEVLWKKLWLDECLKALEGYEVYFVKVFCSDEEGSRREEARGDRHAGWNRGSAYYSDRDCKNDLEIDTTDMPPAFCAAKVAAAIDGGLKPTAFALMRG